MAGRIELLLFIGLLAILTPLFGRYLILIFRDKYQFAPFYSVEKSIYRLSGIDTLEEMTWKVYLKSLLYFNFIGLLFLFFLQMLQEWLPLNPQHFSGVEWPQALNTSISFVTNTNWQSYTGENSLSYLTQMIGLNVQNFLSAATGLTTLLAFTRGVIGKKTEALGNFWVDLIRTVIYILLPLSFIFSLFLVSQGVIQNLSPYIETQTMEKFHQTIPLGPVASQVAIKQLGTNGGGFFNANAAHPFENPTPLSNFFEMFAILFLPGSLVFMYGEMIKSRKESLIIFCVMLTLWIGGLLISHLSETTYNPVLGIHPVLEGKEARFNLLENIMWMISTTGTSNGSVNNLFSSLSPLAGGVALFNILIGEVIFGGIGVGLCSLIMFIFLSVFLAGLMVGRTPEYQGKKIEKKEIQLIMLAILTPSALVLLGSGFTALLPEKTQGLLNKGPHGITELIYAFSSSSGNNGSAFSGLNSGTDFYNLLLGFCMLSARLAIVIPTFAIAGSLANKNYVSPTIGTFTTDTVIFGIILISVILIVGALAFFPSLSLGPIIEQFLMLKGESF